MFDRVLFENIQQFTYKNITPSTLLKKPNKHKNTSVKKNITDMEWKSNPITKNSIQISTSFAK